MYEGRICVRLVIVTLAAQRTQQAEILQTPHAAYHDIERS
jgi:hypothetical protein